MFWAKSVLPLEFMPNSDVGDPLTQHLDALEHQAERKGGALQPSEDHCSHGTKRRPLPSWRNTVAPSHTATWKK
jgi:hypothetical protein